MKIDDLIKLLETYSIDPALTTFHYKVLLSLMKQELTQSEISVALNSAAIEVATVNYTKPITKKIKKVYTTNIGKICRELIEMDYIKISKIQGKNKFYTINLKPNFNKINKEIKGQINAS